MYQLQSGIGMVSFNVQMNSLKFAKDFISLVLESNLTSTQFWSDKYAAFEEVTKDD